MNIIDKFELSSSVILVTDTPFTWENALLSKRGDVVEYEGSKYEIISVESISHKNKIEQPFEDDSDLLESLAFIVELKNK